MKLPGLIVFCCAALLAQSMVVHAGALRMGESSQINALASTDCACQSASPGATIVASSDNDGGSSDSDGAGSCAATPGNKATMHCAGSPAASASVAGKTAPSVTTPRKLRNGVHWQSLLPGVMK